MVDNQKNSLLFSSVTFLVVGLVIAYAFFGVQFSAQLADKEAQLGSLKAQNTGLQGELDVARAPSPAQEVMQFNSCVDEKNQISSLQAQLAAAKKSLSQCDSGSAAAGAGATPSPTASAGFVGQTISLVVGKSFTVPGGEIILSYKGIASNGLALFSLNGLDYSRAVGSFTSISTRDGSKYVVTVNSATSTRGEFVFYNG